MNTREERLCELQADIFELSISLTCSSSYFISKFMRSPTAKELDSADDFYDCPSPETIVDKFKENRPILMNKKGVQYPKPVLRWIGYAYRSYCIIKHRSSTYLYSHMKSFDMASLYDSFHTFSIEYCVDRLDELIQEKNPPIESDYQTYRKIMASK